MSAQINDLVKMGDVQTLYELMAEDDDWMVQLDAAEGLVKLGDVRGLEFLRSAQQSDENDVRQVAREILSNPDIQARRAELEAVDDREMRSLKEAAVKRLQAGGRVFQYKVVFIAAGDLLDEDPQSEGFDVPALTEFGLQGWEVVEIISRRVHELSGGRGGSHGLGSMSLDLAENLSGAYFLLKRRLSASDTAELV